jgi:hypothetical protein
MNNERHLRPLLKSPFDFTAFRSRCDLRREVLWSQHATPRFFRSQVTTLITPEAARWIAAEDGGLSKCWGQ